MFLHCLPWQACFHNYHRYKAVLAVGKRQTTQLPEPEVESLGSLLRMPTAM
jgi:hypothetical protein